MRHEAPGAYVRVRFKVVVLIEHDVIFDHGSVVRRPRWHGPPLAEDAIKSAVISERTTRADARWIEREVVCLDHHVLRLPPAVAVIRLAGHLARVARTHRSNPWVIQSAEAGRAVSGVTAERVGVLPQHHATPVVNEGVPDDRKGVPVRPCYPAVSPGFRNVDRAIRESFQLRSSS